MQIAQSVENGIQGDEVRDTMPTSSLFISEVMDGGLILVVERIEFDYTSNNYFTNNIQNLRNSSLAARWTGAK